MKKAFTIALTLFCASCAPVSKRDVSPLMDRMEQQLRLPSWAKALDAYARYYAYAPSGDVEALYTLPISILACEEQVVSHDGQKQKQCLDIINGPKAGERRWVEDDRHFPLQFDGGCSVIRLVFDPVTAKVKSVRCNGVG